MTLIVPSSEADTWFNYFTAACSKESWFPGGGSEMRPGESEGEVTVLDQKGRTVQHFRWKRKREGDLLIEPSQDPGVLLDSNNTKNFLNQVTQQNRDKCGEKFLNQYYLLMDGPRLEGEFWPDSDTRLRSIEKVADAAVFDEQVIEVDCMLFGADVSHSGELFSVRLKEIAVFFSVICGYYLRLPEAGQVWVVNADGTGSEKRFRGYVNPARGGAMPNRNNTASTPLHEVKRPWFWNPRSDPDGTTFLLPSDAAALWQRFLALSPESRRHFLQAASKLYESKMVANGSPTLSFALKVSAIEALKPRGKKYNDVDALCVVQHLLGSTIRERLEDGFLTKNVHGTDKILQIRHDSFHRGIFWGSEWKPWEFIATFKDPTFDSAHRFVAEVAREAMVAWLISPDQLDGIEAPKKDRRRRSSLKDLIGLGEICVLHLRVHALPELQPPRTFRSQLGQRPRLIGRDFLRTQHIAPAVVGALVDEGGGAALPSSPRPLGP